MPFSLPPLGQPLPFDALVDVRSPAEFQQDHIPGAINLPALSNEERAEVGTIYVRQSRFVARRVGAAKVARNVASHLETALAGKSSNWRPLVYCWRGGQRSGSVASIFRQIGWQAEVIEGGYRAFRRSVHDYLYEQELGHRIVLLDGGTGTAKTELLARVAGLGAQVLDLEALAGHRGSLFGGLSDGQPTQKAFETRLATALGKLDPDRPVLLEAESNKIGSRIIPPSLWEKMRNAPRVTVSAPIESRAKFTMRAYSDIAQDPERIADILQNLRPYHGAEQVARWCDLVHQDLPGLIRELMELHYDPRYLKSSARSAASVKVIDLPGLEDCDLDRGADVIARSLDAIAKGPET